jgi:hypothetical protein
MRTRRKKVTMAGKKRASSLEERLAAIRETPPVEDHDSPRDPSESLDLPTLIATTEGDTFLPGSRRLPTRSTSASQDEGPER